MKNSRQDLMSIARSNLSNIQNRIEDLFDRDGLDRQGIFEELEMLNRDITEMKKFWKED